MISCIKALHYEDRRSLIVAFTVRVSIWGSIGSQNLSRKLLIHRWSILRFDFEFSPAFLPPFLWADDSPLELYKKNWFDRASRNNTWFLSQELVWPFLDLLQPCPGKSPPSISRRCCVFCWRISCRCIVVDQSRLCLGVVWIKLEEETTLKDLAHERDERSPNHEFSWLEVSVNYWYSVCFLEWNAAEWPLSVARRMRRPSSSKDREEDYLRCLTYKQLLLSTDHCRPTDGVCL